MQITNFKSIRGLEIATNRSLLISGENGSGKTSILESITWCLFGKDLNRSMLNPKPVDIINEPEVGREPSVELTINGKVFRRVLQENWATDNDYKKVYSGNTTNFFIDGVPVKAGEFKAEVEAIITEDDFYLCCVPGYFMSEKNKRDERRKQLLSLVDYPSFDLIVARNGDLKALGGISDIEAEKQKQLARIKLIDGTKDKTGRLKQIGIEIKTYESTIRETSLSESAIRQQIETLKSQVFPDNQKAMYEKIEIIRKNRQTKLDRLEEDVLRRRDAIQIDSESGEYPGETLLKVKSAQFKTKDEISKHSMTVDNIKHKIKDIESKSKTCSACGQLLPKEKLALYQGEADGLKEKLSQYQQELARLQELLLIQNKQVEEEQFKVDEYARQIEKRRATRRAELDRLNVEASEKRAEFDAEFDVEKAKIEAEYKQMNTFESEKAERDGKIQELNRQLYDINENNKTQAKIKALQEEAKSLTIELEDAQRMCYLIDQYNRVWADLIETPVNDLFMYAQFKLFNRLVNGSLEPTCEAMYDGKTEMSTGESILVGTDICNTFGKIKGVTLPILVDNKESLTKSIKTDRITIETMVKKTTLNVEEL